MCFLLHSLKNLLKYVRFMPIRWIMDKNQKIEDMHKLLDIKKLARHRRFRHINRLAKSKKLSLVKPTDNR